MYLCMDDNGRLYQAASYRADGRGFETLPQEVDSGDLCLSSPNIRQAQNSTNEWAMLKSVNALEDEADLRADYARRHAKRAAYQREQQEQMRMQIPSYKSKLTNDAAIQTMAGADFSTNSIWGQSSGKFANGLGRTNDEILREAAILQSMGEIPTDANTAEINTATVNVDPYEIEQYYLNQQAGKMVQSETEKIALQKEREIYEEKAMKSKLQAIDSTQDSVLAEKSGDVYLDDEQEKTTKTLKTVGLALGALAIFNMIRG
jgi:hypothetical protein